LRKRIKEKTIVIADRVVEYSLYGLIFFIPISNAAIEIFASLAILAFMVKKILQPKFIFKDSLRREQPLLLTHLFLLSFFVFCGLSSFNSGAYLKKSIEALVFKWAEYILIFLIIEDTLASRQHIRNVIVILLAVGGVVAFDVLSQRFFGWEFLRGRQIKEGVSAITGPFHHHNGLAAYLVCILSLMLALLSCVKFKKKIYYFGPFFIIVLLGLSFLFTFSRGGWIGFIAVGLLMLFLSRKWKVILPVFFIFILLVALVPAIRERAIFTFQAGGDASRFAMWQGAWAMIKENPFLGKGLGTFMAYFPRYAPNLGIQYAHNSFLQIWTETGIFSLLSFLGFLISLLYLCIKVFKKSQDFILLGLICGIFGFLVHSFFDAHFYSLQLSVFFWSMAGIAQALANTDIP
jgi:O-antigen ligase